MKFQTITTTRMAEHTRHGRTVTVPEKHSVQVPKAPFNADLFVRRGMFASALLVTAGTIIWGTNAIGSMLATLAPSWAAYLVAGVFDLAWVACLAAEWSLRYDHRKARVPRGAGMVALAISMTAIITHGVLLDAVMVGVIGGLVAAMAKGMWEVTLYANRVKLDPADLAYIDLMKRETSTKLALAVSERDREYSEAKAAQLRLSLAHVRESATQDRLTATHAVESATQDRLTAVESPTQPVEFAQVSPVELTTQVRESAVSSNSPEVETLVSRLKAGESLSAARAAELLGVSKATGGRRLAEARAAHAAGLMHQTGQYL